MMLLAPLGHAIQQLVGLINNQVRALPGGEKDEGSEKQFSIGQLQPGDATLPGAATRRLRRVGERGCGGEAAKRRLRPARVTHASRTRHARVPALSPRP